jgi:hypothetical protein
LDCPGDPGSIPGRTYEHDVHCDCLSIDFNASGIFVEFLGFFSQNQFFSDVNTMITVRQSMAMMPIDRLHSLKVCAVFQEA